MKFFLPGVDDGERAETGWEQLRIWVDAPPQSGPRISSVQFEQDGAAWVATVGKAIASATDTRSAKSKKDSSTEPGATVLAIFSGSPYIIAQKPDELTKWANPLVVEEAGIRETELFDEA